MARYYARWQKPSYLVTFYPERKGFRLSFAFGGTSPVVCVCTVDIRVGGSASVTTDSVGFKVSYFQTVVSYTFRHEKAALENENAGGCRRF